MIHGSNATKEWGFFPWLAEVLCDEGFAVCRFNGDLARAVRQCQTHVALPTFLFAFAEGADVVIEVPNLRGVILWSAAHAPTVSVPLLLINSADSVSSDVSSVVIHGADREFSNRRQLILAADITARFISAYS